MCCTRAAALVFLLCAALAGSRARAAPAVLEWDAPAACPGASALYERLSAALGHEPQTLGRLSRVRGSVVPSPGGYRLTLEVSEADRKSSRLVEAEDCDDLVEAAVLAITLALSPESAAAQTPASAAPEASAGAAAAPVAPVDAGAEPSAVSSGAAASPLQGFASLAAVAELGAFPHPAAGVSVSAGARRGALSLSGYGTLFAAQQLAAAPGQFVEFELLLAGLRGCYALVQRRLGLDACAGFELGRFTALGLDLSDARRTRDAWLAPLAALTGHFQWTRALSLELRAEAAVPLARKRYLVNEIEQVHSPDALSVRLLGGFALSSQ